MEKSPNYNFPQFVPEKWDRNLFVWGMDTEHFIGIMGTKMALWYIAEKSGFTELNALNAFEQVEYSNYFETSHLEWLSRHFRIWYAREQVFDIPTILEESAHIAHLTINKTFRKQYLKDRAVGFRKEQNGDHVSLSIPTLFRMNIGEYVAALSVYQALSDPQFQNVILDLNTSMSTNNHFYIEDARDYFDFLWKSSKKSSSFPFLSHGLGSTMAYTMIQKKIPMNLRYLLTSSTDELWQNYKKNVGEQTANSQLENWRQKRTNDYSGPENDETIFLDPSDNWF